MNEVTTTAGRQARDDNSQASWRQAWMHMHVAPIQLLESYLREDMRNWILLDSQSSTLIFCSSIVKIPDDKPNLMVETNGGTFKVSQQAQVEGFGTVWFNESSLTNVFSHAEMAD